MRAIPLVVAICVLTLLVGCGRSDAGKQKADIDARIAEELKAEKAAQIRRREAGEAESREAARTRELEIRKESADAFAKFNSERPPMSAAEEANALDVAVARVRARMTEPAAMQVQGVRFSTPRSAVCMAVNYKEGGKYLGSRQAFVTPNVIWVEPAAEDPSHQGFELNYKQAGC
jgi:hypothetical protein